jgi:hypothetical protein
MKARGIPRGRLVEAPRGGRIHGPDQVIGNHIVVLGVNVRERSSGLGRAERESSSPMKSMTGNEIGRCTLRKADAIILDGNGQSIGTEATRKRRF